ncbi:unnamed protein product [Cladocopium goreaui]|uniref:Reverse transcriptase domain-containing protein n=1 Tax=Cladocopium goreaui TaxID=2562237 RepID=A0A9P1DN72_9DINO|nr:unnamed protein product [Cladocopium goreaui]
MAVNKLELLGPWNCTHTTWRAPHGHSEHCIDFVTVPAVYKDQCTLSKVVEDFDLHNGDGDHSLVALQLAWSIFSTATTTASAFHAKINFDRSKIKRDCILDGVAAVPAPAWHTDVHTHFHVYNQALRDCLTKHCPKSRSSPKKSFITKEIWDIRKRKLACKKQLRALGRRTKQETLSAFFQAWARGLKEQENDHAESYQHYMVTISCWRLKLGIKAIHLAAHMKQQLQTARKYALSASLQELPDSASANLILQTIKEHIGPTNLRHLKRKTIRQTQADLLEKYMMRSQLGGKRHVPVTLGLHEARAYLRAAAADGHSAVLLMVDLVEAFYRVLRPLALGNEYSDEEIAKLAHKLRLPDDALHQLYAHLADPSAIAKAGMTMTAQQVLQAIHSDTFSQMPGQIDICRTTVGTRPGDSFADVVFTFLFSRVLENFHKRLQQQELQEYVQIDPQFDPFRRFCPDEGAWEIYSGPVWMDDLTVVLRADNADAAIQKAGVVSSILLDTLEEHAMTPNLQKGKTALLFALKGRGCRKRKSQFFGPNSPGTMTVIGEHSTRQISVVGEYVHLGGVLHHRGDHRKEMRRRVAMAHQTFNAHRRHIFQNAVIPLDRRVQLFQSLVLSRLLYGSESWHLCDVKSKGFLHTSIIKLYKRLLKLQPAATWTDDEICVALQLPTPTELLRRVRLRYLGTLHQCEDTVSWRILHNDKEWCTLIVDDLQWLWRQICTCTYLPDPASNLEPWRYLWRFHQPYWKGLIRRAFLHAALQRQNQLLVRQNFVAFLHVLKEEQVIRGQISEPRVCGAQNSTVVYGCLCCKKAFRSRGHGPSLPDDRLREVELFDIELYAKVTELFLQSDPETHAQELFDLLTTQPISWTACCGTLRAIQTNATVDDAKAFGYDQLQQFLSFLDGFCDPKTWEFLLTHTQHDHQPDIEELEQELAYAEVLESAPRPAAFGAHRLAMVAGYGPHIGPDYAG